MRISEQRNILILGTGDLLAIFLVTWVGFAMHGSSLSGTRWLATFMPTTAAWLIFAPLLRLYQPETWSRPAALWKPALAAILAAPLASVLRGLWLDALITPIFPLVLGGSAALGMLIWRALYLLLQGVEWMKPR